MSDLWEHIDLCSGIGGFSLGFQYAKLSEPILFCELDEFCQKILKKQWPNVPICNDVKELANDTNAFIPRPRGRKRILTGGYPCQSFSQAGKRLGWEDPRAIWPYIFRIVQQERFDVCVFENVSGHISLGLDEVLHDLEGEGYTTRTFVCGAEAVGAPHKRNRLWIIARNMGNANDNGSSTTEIRRSNQETARGSQKGQIKTEQSQGTSGRENHDDVADTDSERTQSRLSRNENAEDARQSSRGKEQGGRNTQLQMGKLAHGIRSRLLGSLEPWPEEPTDIPRVATGQKDRSKKLKALGNAIVPQIAQRIGIAIRESF